MSYEKQTWVTGETITAEKLNHMEDGIGGVVLAVNFTQENSDSDWVCDKTFLEVKSAFENNMIVFAVTDSPLGNQHFPLTHISDEEGAEFVGTFYSIGVGTASGALILSLKLAPTNEVFFRQALATFVTN